MIVNGVEVSPAVEQALEAWMQGYVEQQAGFRASDLVAKVKTLNVSVDEAVSMRVADRMLQKNKRRRNIKLFGANNWCWIKSN